jgi:SAM-dependent methyltransferase
MRECSKSIVRRLLSANYATRYFRGKGVDIGGAPDPLELYRSLFPLMEEVKTWDMADGDAQFMAGVADGTYDFVHSSHCLEHLNDPQEGLQNWFRILRPGGHLTITFPDEDLYEQGTFPSTFNRTHKATFTIFKPSSWSDRSFNVTALATSLGPSAQIIKIEQIDLAYRYDLPRFDQTLTPVSESCIELVVRKRRPEEVSFHGQPARTTQPEHDIRIHLNQYLDDQRRLRESNVTKPPFTNDDSIRCA